MEYFCGLKSDQSVFYSQQGPLCPPNSAPRNFRQVARNTFGAPPTHHSTPLLPPPTPKGGASSRYYPQDKPYEPLLPPPNPLIRRSLDFDDTKKYEPLSTIEKETQTNNQCNCAKITDQESELEALRIR